MDYKGCIIEESLSDISIIKELEIINTHVSKTTKESGTPWLEKWTLQTVIIPENKIEEYSKRLSKLIDKKHISNWYCDFSNDKNHYVIFSDKIFKLDIKRREDYIEMRKYGIEIGVPEYQLPIFNDEILNI